MFAAAEVIQAVVTPVVMVSANGLLCLAFYNRLSSIANRTRTLNKERVELATELGRYEGRRRSERRAMRLERRAVDLDELVRQLYRRAQWVQRTLFCLLSSILCMLACSLFLGLAYVAPALERMAIGLFVAGVACMMAGGLAAMRELRLSLAPLLFESERLELERDDEEADAEPKLHPMPGRRSVGS